MRGEGEREREREKKEKEKQKMSRNNFCYYLQQSFLCRHQSLQMEERYVKRSRQSLCSTGETRIIKSLAKGSLLLSISTTNFDQWPILQFYKVQL